MAKYIWIYGITVDGERVKERLTLKGLEPVASKMQYIGSGHDPGTAHEYRDVTDYGDSTPVEDEFTVTLKEVKTNDNI